MIKVILFVSVLFAFSSVASPGKRPLEKYFLVEMGKSLKMIKNDENGAKQDFLSDFGYSNEDEFDDFRVFNRKYKGTLWCNDKREDAVISFNFQKNIFHVNIKRSTESLQASAHRKDLKFSGKRFFLDSPELKMKGVLGNRSGSDEKSITWIRYIDSKGNICGIPLLIEINK